MIPRLTLSVLAFAASVAHAWLPGTGVGKRSIADLDGYSLFNETVSAAAGNGKRWLPSSGKVRGVNLGSLFIVEPWMMSARWAEMGCAGGKASEFDCMMTLKQDAGDRVFQNHWSSWITAGDFDEMVNSGLNTVRIPLGYWIMEELVDRKTEYFPRGGLQYLKRVCGWASDRGLYIILELHGAPGAQVTGQSFTGQLPDTAGFYQTYQYDRAIKFVAWLRRLIHDNRELRNAGMIGLVNEPLQNNAPESLRSYYYPKALQAIRDTEAALGISPNDFVHVQMMNAYWGSGDPTQFLPSTYFVAYDDHRYLKWASPDLSQDGYVRASCGDNRAAAGQSATTIVGEWSVSVPDDKQWTDGWRPDTHKEFYGRWFAAQVLAYEKYTLGWTFWSWKTQLGDYRWGYKDALAEGVIPKNLNSIATSGVCDGL